MRSHEGPFPSGPGMTCSGTARSACINRTQMPPFASTWTSSRSFSNSAALLKKAICHLHSPQSQPPPVGVIVVTPPPKWISQAGRNCYMIVMSSMARLQEASHCMMQPPSSAGAVWLSWERLSILLNPLCCCGQTSWKPLPGWPIWCGHLFIPMCIL